MSYGKASFLGAASLCLAFACGGSSFRSGDGEGGDAGSSGGSMGRSGSSSTAGKGGSSATGGSKGMGTAGTVAVAGGVGIGGMNCGLVLCAYPDCADGEMPVTPPGECCPRCPGPLSGCDGVTCEPAACKAGYEPGRPAGACCDGCIPIPGMIACPEIACPPENHCPLGYVPGDKLGGCCADCVPDPLFCNSDDECVIADRPRPCCGCPEPITMREYNADPCWTAPSMPRMYPPECQPQYVCDAVCSPCPPPGPVACVEHRCTELPAP